ncbi:Protein mesA [Spathaspora sp. JA1]|nr:Protein mesA [Spathaspora sp. JA1]
MPNIEYIITAEFDIDKGPSLIHQYPQEIPGIGNLYFLPELMIPDQIHTRQEDYTLFLLYKDLTTQEFQYRYEPGKCERVPYFLYTIVVSRTADSFKRGAQIKSLSIITKLTYFKNFRPLLLISLDMYFQNGDVEILQELYDSINVKNFTISEKQSMSIIKKLLVTSILDLPINDKIYSDGHFRNQILGIPKESVTTPDLFMRKDLSFNSIVSFNNMNIPVRIPLLELPDTIGDYLNPTDLNFKPNLIKLLRAKLASGSYLNPELTVYGLQTPPIIILINAFLTGKKIALVSYENSSEYIIDFILLILKIVTGGGILSGFLTNYNVFPIIDVSKIDLLNECESYIAGTINPFFKQNDRLWDVMFDLDTNEIYLSSQIGEQQQQQSFRSSIISEDAKFLSNLQLSLFTYNDDLTTIQLILRRHINEIVRILLSSKNFKGDDNNLTLLLDGVGYYWASDSNKLMEVSCYQSVSKKFQDILYRGVLNYSLLLPNLKNELNLVLDIQHHLQILTSSASSNIQGNVKVNNEREIWFNILKFLISGPSLELLLLITYLIPSNSSTSFQEGNSTVFDKNKGIEFLLINLFNMNDQVKSNVVLILQELNDNFICEWCLDKYLHSNIIYEMAYKDLVQQQQQ